MPVPCYDTVVVGAGPAGATAAYLLARRGARVLLLDQAVFPRPKLCAGLLTWKTIRLVEGIFRVPLARLREEGIIRFASRDYGIRNTRGYLLRGRLDVPFHFTERLRYDQFWLGRAAFAGARIRLGERVAGVDPDRGLVHTTGGGRYRGRLVIAADGARSRVRSALVRQGRLTPPDGRQMAAALELFVPRAGFPGPGNEASIYFGFVPWGYAWSFPGAEHQVLGICALAGKPARVLREGLERFLASLSLPAEHARRARAAPLPYGNFLQDPGYGRVLLTGDAAGLADPLLGEGIYYAHQSGRLAAEAGLDASDHPLEALAAYRRTLARTLLPELQHARRWRFLLHRICGCREYAPVALLARAVRKPMEETVHGQRSFAGMRRLPPPYPR